jgi:phage regulator Rha-like protein
MRLSPAPASQNLPIPLELIERRIHSIRGHKVMLDSDLAAIYQVPTKRVNEAVKRNLPRFPQDFMLRLTAEEAISLRSQNAASNQTRGGRRHLPYAFTEHGVAMLSSVLTGERAVQMNILIVRAFIQLRDTLASHRDLAARMDKVEVTQKQHTSVIGAVVDEIKRLQTPSAVTPKRRIGFSPESRQR